MCFFLFHPPQTYQSSVDQSWSLPFTKTFKSNDLHYKDFQTLHSKICSIHLSVEAADSQWDGPRPAFSEEIRRFPPEAILHHHFWRIFKRLLSSSHTYPFYWLWSTWSQSWFWIFNVHLEHEKRIPLSELFGSNKGFN